MPSFTNPTTDAEEAYEALRGLAHATSVFEDPAETYPVLGNLLAATRALNQVLDQLATAHETARLAAFDDHGNHAAGAADADTAAAELREAAALAADVTTLVDAAMAHSGRIAWQPDQARQARRVQAGTLALTVWPDTPLGEHQRYAYQITDTTTGRSIAGRDLFTGAGAPVAPQRAITELAVFLHAAAEAHQHTQTHPGSTPSNTTGNGNLFPAWVGKAAADNADELTLLTLAGTPEPDTTSPGTPAPGTAGPEAADPDRVVPGEGRWISVVFLEGAQADELVDRATSGDTDAVIEHLAGYDMADETVQAALENGYVYDTPPVGTLDRTATRDAYMLVYNPHRGHLNLLRRHDDMPDPVLLGITDPPPAPAPPVPSQTQPVRAARPEVRARAVPVEPARRPAKPAGLDWFGHHGSSTSTSRGRAL